MPGGGNRRQAATQLDTVAADLRAHYRDARRSWPKRGKENVQTYWLTNIETVKGDIQTVEDAADVASDIVVRPSENLSLTRLISGLQDARKAVLAALRAFEASDDAGQFETQSDLYFKALDQLQALANLCQALAQQLRAK